MRRRRRIIILTISLVAFILAACLTAVFLSVDVQISLNEGNTSTIEVFSEFNDPGAKGNITIAPLGLKLQVKVLSTDNIDNNKLGVYKKEYKASFLGKETIVSRDVEVVDKTSPEIIADSTITVDFTNGQKINVQEIPFSFKATDKYDGDVTSTVIKSYDQEGCTLTATDSSGNTSSFKVMFDYVDKEAPKITLEGGLPLYLEIGEKYTPLKFSATDNVDGDMTEKVKVTNLPDTGKAGTYNVTYEVTDASNNKASVTQKVVVYEKWNKESHETIKPAGKTIYLTFDDGPGKYTEYLLNLLKRYDVKATFFVTDQFPKYRDSIKEAFNSGHSIGAHTYSHRFDNIYSSLENYLKDFEKIQALIEALTGERTKIFRFPGGTSNTVSQKYATGIMKALENKMTADGYVYFDWNFDCGDTAGKNAKQIANGVLNHIDTRFKTEDYTIILMHDIKIETIRALPEIIEYCLNKGYTFAVLDENSPNRQFSVKN